MFLFVFVLFFVVLGWGGVSCFFVCFVLFLFVWFFVFGGFFVFLFVCVCFVLFCVCLLFFLAGGGGGVTVFEFDYAYFWLKEVLDKGTRNSLVVARETPYTRTLIYAIFDETRSKSRFKLQTWNILWYKKSHLLWKLRQEIQSVCPRPHTQAYKQKVYFPFLQWLFLTRRMR